MTPPTNTNPSYKELTLQQLRSFCETARVGSFMGAAAAMGVSHPTVWKQVHALEREFGTQLVEPHGRGCYLTAAGRLLVDMAGPPVETIAALQERFRAALRDVDAHLTVALTPRMLVEEFAGCVVKSSKQSPRTRFSFLELSDAGVAAAVESRQADFGFTPEPLTPEQSQQLVAEECYRLEVRLVTPARHPLARKRTVHPRDLRPYPFVNLPDAFSSPAVLAKLNRYGVYEGKPHGVRTGYVHSIRRFVELGFGIGLVPVAPTTPTPPKLHERSLSRHFGSIPVLLIRRRAAHLSAAGDAFIRLVRDELKPR